MIKSILKGMLTVFKHLFMRPVTLEYPEKKRQVPNNFRGKPVLKNECCGCGTCIRVCPSGAIKIKESEFIIDLNKCIFCGNCAFYCPQNAIEMSKEYELATENKDKLKLVYTRGRKNQSERTN